MLRDKTLKEHEPEKESESMLVQSDSGKNVSLSAPCPEGTLGLE